MKPLVLDIPTIAITGSTGKTTTREFIVSIVESKWKILKSIGNKNLPYNTRNIANRYDSSCEAMVLEMGMGKPDAAKRHCRYLQPNISVITNIGTAHYGSLGNSYESTAKNKSGLIKRMKQDGQLFLNGDDRNSELLDTHSFKGSIIKIGIHTKADYQATDIHYTEDGMEFTVLFKGKEKPYFIPTFGIHNVYNALFAIAICHELHFTAAEIRKGLKNFTIPIKRLNRFPLRNNSLLIDDTANANPHSVKAGIDVLNSIGKGKKKILVLGDMLELGNYSKEGHIEVGEYAVKRNINYIYTFGQDSKWVIDAAIKSGFPPLNAQHFISRDELHNQLKQLLTKNDMVLVKGSSAMKMDDTVKMMKHRYMFTINLDDSIRKNQLMLSRETYDLIGIKSNRISFHFGAYTRVYKIKLNDQLAHGEIRLSPELENGITIPSVPYEVIIEDAQLFLGPIIGINVYQRYMDDPPQQLLRLSQYEKIGGLIFLFNPTTIDYQHQTMSGFYFDQESNSFKSGVFPYPSSFFNRVPLRESRYQYFKRKLGDTIFNYPYGNTNKLDFWNIMSRNSNIKDALPLTSKYKNINSVLRFLQTNDSAYIKPSTLAGGNGILHIKKVDNHFVVTDRDGGKEKAASRKALNNCLNEKLVENKEYIIQQEIVSVNPAGEKVDFRMYIQKDGTQKWKYSGLETKVANKGSIISNSQNRNRVVPGLVALQEFYGLSQLEAEEKIMDISNLCITVLKTLEKQSMHLGDTAIDFVIDENLHVYLLEVQVNYAAEIKAFREEDERSVLPNILPTPLEYAKSLTKFK
ncbi:YheC/YheD family protein [Rossellomorea oryzaecorticis]|uniref:YheC/YheD family protein n=1 Tax=Rossellomorea oryzaecorticis TaxID=1396505 RepID=A0ABU9K9C3_9BACI